MTGNHVAVIGAGVAGLTAACRLAHAGLDVVVFDKARGVGGRTSTRRSDVFAFDHGAQYFTCRSDAFTQQVGDWCRRGVAAPWDATIATLGAADSAASAKLADRFVGVPGMSALARDLAEGLRVECGHRIESVEGGPGCWSLITEDGARQEGFDSVVVATPAPQAVPLLASHPGFAESAARVEMQPCHAVMLTFAEGIGVDFDGAFVENSPLGWVARNASKPGRPPGECWVLHTTPEWSGTHLATPIETVMHALLLAFGRALGQALPDPTFQAAHRWSLARTDEPLGEPFLWAADSALGVCGDWLHGSRVEDAYLSGAQLAEAMLFKKAGPSAVR